MPSLSLLVDLECLGQGHEVTPIGAVRPLHGLAGFGLRLLELPAERGELGLELEDPLHAGEVEALVGEVLDEAEPLDVVLGVAATAAPGAGRIDQPLPFV